MDHPDLAKIEAYKASLPKGHAKRSAATRLANLVWHGTHTIESLAVSGEKSQNVGNKTIALARELMGWDDSYDGVSVDLVVNGKVLASAKMPADNVALLVRAIKVYAK